jgi:hypothetical protein
MDNRSGGFLPPRFSRCPAVRTDGYSCRDPGRRTRLSAVFASQNRNPELPRSPPLGEKTRDRV